MNDAPPPGNDRDPTQEELDWVEREIARLMVPDFEEGGSPRIFVRAMRVNEEEGRAVDALSEQAGLTVSDYLRRLTMSDFELSQVYRHALFLLIKAVRQHCDSADVDAKRFESTESLRRCADAVADRFGL